MSIEIMNQTTHKVVLDNTERIEQQRDRISRIMRREDAALLSIMGPCSLQLGATHIREAEHINRCMTRTSGEELMHVSRLPTWKPRTNDDDWHGIEETEPDQAMHQIARAVRRGVPVTLEVGNAGHVTKYRNLLSMMWIGSRSHDLSGAQHTRLITACGVIAPDIPLGIKSTMDGNIGRTLQLVSKIEKVRNENSDNPAAVTMIYRGGSKVTDPKKWEKQVKLAAEKTEGRVLIDTAHGSEMAHDPNKQMRKTVDGQVRALDHVWSLMKSGISISGVMIEASDLLIEDETRRTDPNMSIVDAKSRMRDIAKLVKRRSTQQPIINVGE